MSHYPLWRQERWTLSDAYLLGNKTVFMDTRYPHTTITKKRVTVLCSLLYLIRRPVCKHWLWWVAMNTCGLHIKCNTFTLKIKGIHKDTYSLFGLQYYTRNVRSLCNIKACWRLYTYSYGVGLLVKKCYIIVTIWVFMVHPTRHAHLHWACGPHDPGYTHQVDHPHHNHQP